MDILIQVLSTIFWFIVILIPLVAIHEFGHLIISKLVGVKVVEYGIGIPPRVISRRWKGIIWSLNWLPIGGFAKIYGDHDAIDEAEDLVKTDPEKARETYGEIRLSEILSSGDLEYFLVDNNLDYNEEWQKLNEKKGRLTEQDYQTFDVQIRQLKTLIDWEYDIAISSKRAFCNVSWWRKALILLGGVTFNFLTAIILFFLVFSLFSTPPVPVFPEDIDKIRSEAQITFQSENLKVLRILPDTPAARSGLEPGDDLIRFGNQDLNNLKNFSEFTDIVRSQSSKNTTVTYRDNDTGEEITRDIELEERDGTFFFGLQSDYVGYFVRYRYSNPWVAFQKATSRSTDIFLLNYRYLGEIIASPFTRNFQAVEGVGGPIAIGSVGSTIFQFQGVSGIISIIAVISIALAAFNLLPIPALDGGRLIIVTLNSIFKKRNKRLEAIVIGITFVVMLVLAGAIAIWDVYRIASGQGFGL